MSNEKIRPIAICIFLNDDRILVAEASDTRKNQIFYRPLGGTIEFGEHSQDTIRRELREEIGAEISDLHYLGTLENIFTYEGRRGHEIVLVYDARFIDQTLYEKELIEGFEVDIGKPFKIVWKGIEEFSSGQPPVYPDGLLELLAETRCKK
jgi:8-oxo-dGTP pyrophosphatase MutT (NUDIX family)